MSVPAKQTPHDFVHEKDVAITLNNDKGEKAILKSFAVEDFTKKGENYSSAVLKVTVNYTDNGDYQETYIVKTNPLSAPEFNPEVNFKFVKETGFLDVLIPMLNSELQRSGEKPLRVATCFHSVLTSGQEVMYLEDLNKQGYKMVDRKKGFDKEHTQLIIGELARLHAASSLMLSRKEFQGIDIHKRFPILAELLTSDLNKSKMNMKSAFEKIWLHVMGIVQRCEGYERVTKYLFDTKDTVYGTMTDQLEHTEQFKVICHGDCWSNNCLFRYSDAGKVEECRLLDFQATRVGSPALDLNFMMFCSLNSDLRQASLSDFLTNYYAVFASVIAGSGVTMKFTREELVKQYHDKKAFGYIRGIMITPIVFMNSDDLPERAEINYEDEEQMKKFMEVVMEAIMKNPILKPRLLSIFDEMIESGFIQ